MAISGPFIHRIPCNIGSTWRPATSASASIERLPCARATASLAAWDIRLSTHLLTVSREPTFRGRGRQTGRQCGTIIARYLVRYENDDGRPTTRVVTLEGRARRKNPALSSAIEWLGNGAGRKRIKTIGSATGYRHGRQSFRGGEEQHDSRLDTGSVPTEHE